MRLLAFKAVFALLAAFFFLSVPTAQAQVSNLVIAEIYGGGSNSGSYWNHDYVVLFNTGTTAVSLSGTSLQYAGATGNTWTRVNLSGTVYPKSYFLIRLDQGAQTGQADLFNLDQAPGTINPNVSNGKFVLSSGTSTYSSSCPSTNVIDKVGYGSSADCYEGSDGTPTPSATTSVRRANYGTINMVNGNDNNADFSTVTLSASNPPLGTNQTGTGLTYTFSASSAVVGASFTVTAPAASAGGGHLFASSGISSITVGGVSASYTVTSDRVLTITVPICASTGSQSVVVNYPSSSGSTTLGSITVNAPAITSSGGLCAGSATLTTSYSLGTNEAYYWSNGATTQSITPTSAGTYTLRIRNTASACTSVTSNSITVGAAAGTPTIAGPTQVCSGTTVTLSTPYVLATNESYLWSTGSTASSISVSSAGTYTLRIINSSSACTSSTISHTVSTTTTPTAGSFSNGMNPSSTVSVGASISHVAISSQGVMAVASGNNVLLYSTPTSSSPYLTLNRSTGVTGVAFSPDGNKLIVAQSTSMVVVYNSLPTTSTQSPDVKLSHVGEWQASSNNSYYNPQRPAVAPDGRLIVPDYAIHRFVIHNAIPTSNYKNADVVFGSNGQSSTQVNTPRGAAVSIDGKLVIADGGNQRLLVFNSIPTSSSTPADYVIGQTGFNVNTSGTSSTKLSTPIAVAISATGKLAVADWANNRVLIYNSIPTSHGAAADVVLGQADFTSSASSTALTGMNGPNGVAWLQDGRLAVADAGNNRILIFSTTTCSSDLSLLLSVDNNNPCPGANITYTLEYYNFNSTSVYNPQISFAVPYGFTYVSSSSGSYNGTTGVWSPGTIANNTFGSVTVTAQVPVTSPSTTRIAYMSLAGATNTETTLSNNSASVSVTSKAQVTPGVSIAKTAGQVYTCSGQSVTLTATPTNGGTSPSYQWKKNGSTISGATSSTWTGVAGTDFADKDTLTVAMTTSSDACTNPYPSTVTSNKIGLGINTPTISGGGAICTGGSRTLTTTYVLGSNESYLWSTGATSGSITVSTAGSYTLRIINTFAACTSAASNTATVTVNSLPTTPTVTSTSTCTGSSPTLTTSYTLGTNEAYLWNTGASTQSISPGAGTYYLAIRNTVTACTSAASNSIIINSSPTAPTITGSSSVCTGSTSTLSTSYALGTNESFLWSSGETSSSIAVSTAGTYTLRVVNSATACTSSASNSITTTVNSYPVITASGSTRFCTGGSVTLTASGGNGSFLWSTGETTASITVSSGNIYSVTSNGCTAYQTVFVGSVQDITVSPTSASTTCNTAATFTAASTGSTGVTQIAGSAGTSGSTNGTGTGAQFNLVTDVVAAPNGDWYVVDFGNSLIRKVVPSTGVVTTFAGSSGGHADGVGTAAKFDRPVFAVMDSKGNLMVADRYNNRIRKIDPAANVTTFAGSGTSAYVNGTGTGASFADPYGIAADGADNIYVSEINSGRIRKISAAGVVTTIATGISGSIYAVAVDRTSTNPTHLYVSRANDILKVEIATGTFTVLAGSSSASAFSDGTGTEARFKDIRGMRLDQAGYLFVADNGNHAIRKVNVITGEVFTLTGTGSSGTTSSTLAASTFFGPHGLDIEANGSLALGEFNSYVVRRISIAPHLVWSTGAVTTSISPTTSGTYTVTGVSPYGCSTSAKSATFTTTNRAELSSSLTGTVCSGGLFSYTPTSTTGGATFFWSRAAVSTVNYNASGSGSGAISEVLTSSTSSAVTVTYQITAIANSCTTNTNVVVTVNPQPVITASGSNQLCSGSSVTLTASGGDGSYAWSTGASTSSISVSAAGTYSLTSNGCTAYYYVYVNSPKTVSISPASGSFCDSTTVTGSAGSTGVSFIAGTYAVSGSANGTGSGAKFDAPTGIAVAPNGDYYVTEQSGHRIRKVVPSTGVVTTYSGGSQGNAIGAVASATFYNPIKAVFDTRGNLFITDRGNNRIKKISPDGIVSVFAGNGAGSSVDGTGTAASFNWPYGLAIDGNDNLYVTEEGSGMVRKITPAGVVTTVLNDGIGDELFGIALDGSNPAYAYLSSNTVIYKLDLSAQTRTTIAGAFGDPGYVNGTGTSARFRNARHMAYHPSGYLYIADVDNHAIRRMNVSTLAVGTVTGSGSSGNATGTLAAGRFAGVHDVAVTPEGNLAVAEYYGQQIKLVTLNPITAWSTGDTTAALKLTASGTYTYTGITLSGCTSTASVSPTITPTPSAPVISGDATVCSGGSTTLTTSYTLGTNEAYLWSNGETTQSISVTTAGTYTLRIRSTVAACTSAASNSIAVTVTAAITTPTITSSSGTSPVCFDGSLTLSASYTLGTNESYLWSNGATTQSISVTSAGTYYLQIRNTVTACTSAASNSIIAAPLPATPTITSSGASPICNSDSVILSTAYALAANEAYLWSTGATTQSITVKEVGTYSLRIVNTVTACTSATSNGITIESLSGEITASGPLRFCQGGSVTLTAPSAAGPWLWSTGATTQSITVTTGATYSVTTGGCTRYKAVYVSSAKTLSVNSDTVTTCATGVDLVASVSETVGVSFMAGSYNNPGTVNNTGASARFNIPSGVTVAPNGDWYIFEYGTRIRKMDPVTKNVTTFAGAASGGSEDGNLTTARFFRPQHGVFDSKGNLFVADRSNNKVRKISPDGIVTTFAGSGVSGRTNGTGIAATFGEVYALAITPGDTIYLTDGTYGDIRRITPEGVVSTVYTTGLGNGLFGLALDGANANYLYYVSGTTVFRLNISAGTSTTLAGSGTGYIDATGTSARFNGLRNILYHPAGYLYLCDIYNNSIRKLNLSSLEVKTLAGNGTQGNANSTLRSSTFYAPHGIAFTPEGNLAIVEFSGHTARLATIKPELSWNTGAATDSLLAVTTTGTYSVTGISGNGCTTNTATGTVYEEPGIHPGTATITASGGTSFCAGGSVTLSTTYALGTNEAYLWSNGATTSSISATATGNYTLQIVNTVSACTSAASNSIAVTTYSAVPVITGPTSVCTGGTIYLTTSQALATGESYLWSNGSTTQTIAVTTAGTFSLQIINSTNACTTGTSNTIVVTESTAPTITASGSTRFCTGGSVTLTASGGSTYLWSTGETTESITVSTAGTYSVTSGGCTAYQAVYVKQTKDVTVSAAAPSSCAPITLTAAGTGTTGVTFIAGQSATAGNADGTGTGAQFNFNRSIAVAANGDWYVVSAGNHRIRKVVPSTGVVTTFAGTTQGFAEGNGTAARLNSVTDAAFDSKGNLFVADRGNNRIRRIDPLGNVSTFAGSGTAGSTNGTGTAATFDNPWGIAIDGSDNIYVTEQAAGNIRKITPAGVVTTIATGLGINNLYHLALDGANPTYAYYTRSFDVKRVNLSTGAVTNIAGSGSTGYVNGTGTAAMMSGARGIVYDPAGYLYVAELNNHTIRKIQLSDNSVTTLTGTNSSSNVNSTLTASRFTNPHGLALDASGNLAVAEANGNTVKYVTIDPAFSWSTGETTASISATSTGTYSVSGVTAAGCTSTAASTSVTVYGTPATPAITASGATTLCSNSSVTLSTTYTLGTDELYLWSNGASTSSITPTASGTYSLQIVNSATACTSSASNNISVTITTAPAAVSISASGTTLCTDEVITLTASRSLATNESYLWSTGETTQVISVVAAGSYDLRIINSSTACTSLVASTTIVAATAPTISVSGSTNLCPGGSVTLTASGSGPWTWSTGETTQSITVSTGGMYTVSNGSCLGYRPVYGNSSPSVSVTGTEEICNGASSTFTAVNGNSTGVVYVAGLAGSSGTTSGTGSAARFRAMGDVLVAPNGDWYITEYNAERIRKVVPSTGEVSVFAGSSLANSGNAIGQGTNARFQTPVGLVMDSKGFMFVCDRRNHYIRKISPTGSVTNFAGNGTAGSTNGTGTGASFNNPWGLSIDAADNLYVSEVAQTRIRKITPAGVVTTPVTGITGAGYGLAVEKTDNPTYAYMGRQTLHDIVRVNLSTGAYTVVAGLSGSSGFVNATGTSARFNSPRNIKLDATGRYLYVADNGNHAIRRIDLNTNEVTTVLGTGSSGTTSSTIATSTLTSPHSLAIDAAGNIVLAEEAGYIARYAKVDPNYSWSTGATTSTLNLTSAGTYTLTATTAAGCSTTASRSLTVTTADGPTIAASGSTSICSGSSVTLSTTYTLGTNEAYLWSTGATTSSISVSAAGTYTLRIRNTSTACTTAYSNSLSVTVNALPSTPTITAASSTTICANSSVTLSTTYALATNEAYLWSTGATTSSIAASTAGSYTLRIVNTATACTSASSNSLTITTKAVPADVTIAGSTDLCTDGMVTLSASRSLSTNEFYVWSTGATTSSINVFAAGTYTLAIRNSSTVCTSTVASVTVVASAPPVITASGATTFCTGGSVTLTADGSGPWTWSTGATTQSIMVTTGGNYSVSNGTCTGYLPVYVNAQPQLSLSGTPVVCDNTLTTLTANNTNGTGVVYVAGLAGSFGNTDGTGSVARFRQMTDVLVAPNGDWYVSEQTGHRIRKIVPSTGEVTTFAGSTTATSGSANGQGTSASFSTPMYMAMDSKGYIYVADRNNHRIRKISPTGVVTTFAGSGTNAYADGTGTAASFSHPYGLAIDGSDNLYVLENSTTRLRKITPAGVVTTVTNSLGTSFEVEVPKTANPLYAYVSTTAHQIVRVELTTGTVTVLAGTGGSGYGDGIGTAAKFNSPRGIKLDGTGNYLYITEYSNHRIRRLNLSTLAVTTIVGTGTAGTTSSTLAASTLSFPIGVNIDATGNLVVAEEQSSIVRYVKVDPDYSWSTGATTSNINVTTAGTYSLTSTSAAGCSTLLSSTVTTANSPTISASGSTTLCDGGSVTLTASGSGPWNWSTGATTQSITVTSAAMYSVSTDGSCYGYMPVFMGTSPSVSVTGTTDICTGGSSTFTAVNNNSTGVVYVAGLAGTLGVTDGTGSDARYRAQGDVVVAPNGDWYVAEYGANRIRKVVPSTGEATTFVGSGGGLIGYADGYGTNARFDTPLFLAMDSKGHLFVTDRYNHRIRKVSPAGQVTTFAGSGTAAFTNGTGTAAAFNNPYGLAIDGADNLYVTEVNQTRLRKITAAGVVTTITTSINGNAFDVEVEKTANPTYAYVSRAIHDIVRVNLATGAVTVIAGLANNTGFVNGTGTAARFNGIRGLKLDATGRYLYIADNGNHAIRKLDLVTLEVTTVAGTGTAGTTSGTLDVATLTNPHGLAIDASGNLVVAEEFAYVSRYVKIDPNYSWSNGAVGSTAIVTTAGRHTLTGTTAYGCTATANRTLTIFSTAAPVASGADRGCMGSTVTLTTPYTLNANEAYLWSTGETTQSITVSTAGTYSLQIVGTAAGCTTAVSNAITVTMQPVGTWLGFSADWSSASNWCGGIPGPSSSITVPGSGTDYNPVISATEAECGNLTLDQGASLSLTTGATFRSYGTISGRGTMAGATGTTLEMAGSSLQSLPAMTLGKLRVNNSAGVALSGQAQVLDSVSLVRGSLDASDHALVLMPTAATLVEDSARRVIGKIQARGRQVGTGTFNMLGVQLAAGADDLDTVYVARIDSATNVGSKSSINHLWQIRAHRQPTTGRAITLNWLRSMTNGREMEYAQVWRSANGTTWEPVGSSQNIANSTGTYGITVNTTSFSDWTVSDELNPLPVTLLSFGGKRQGAKVQLQWATVKEHNNQGWVVERSADGRSFQPIGRVRGAGNSSDLRQYALTDNHRAAAWYRLRQQDFDGREELSQSVYVPAADGEISLKLYPNPTHGLVNLELMQQQAVPYRMFNILGHEVMSGQLLPGHNQLDLQALPAGTYFLEAAGFDRARVVRE